MADPRLRAVCLDTDGHHSYFGLALDGQGRLFVGGKEELYVYEPKPGGLFRARRELWRFPPDSWISSIALRGHDLYVLTASALYVFPNGDVQRRHLQPRKVLWGYPNFYCHNAFHGMTFGPDGDLYIAMGDPGFYLTHVTLMPDHWGRWVFHHGPDGAQTTYTGTGGILRLSPDGRELSVFAGGIHNDCGLAFDAQWNLFGSDNDHEQNEEYIPARLLYIAEHANFGWARGWMPEKQRWRSDLLQTMTADLGRCVPVGICYYNDPLLPEEYRGQLFLARWENDTVPSFSYQRLGDTFKADEHPFLSTRGAGQARPLSVATGRGGRLFVVACYLAHNEDSPAFKTHLLMVTRRDDPDDAPYQPYDETRATLAQLFRDLTNSSWDRQFRAHVELTRRGPEAFQMAAARLKSFDPSAPDALHLIWLAAAAKDPETLSRIRALTQNQPQPVRLNALRALSRFAPGQPQEKTSIQALADPDLQILNEALIGLADSGATPPFERVAAICAATLKDLIADGASGTTGTNWEEGSYVRQCAALLLARRASQAQISSLCQSADPALRLTGILAAGIRMTLLAPAEPFGTEVPTISMLNEAYKRFSFTNHPDDKPYIAAGRFFSTRDLWLAKTLTPEQLAFRALLEKGVHDSNLNIARQALYFLRFMRHRWADSVLATKLGMDSAPQIPRHSIRSAVPATATQMPPEYKKFDWQREAAHGNPTVGRSLFLERGCNQCHSIAPGDGGSGGPSLAEAGSRLSFPYMAESVMAPNAVVLPDYRWTSFTLNDGTDVNGLVTSESGTEVEVLMPNGVRQTLQKGDIARRRLENHSPMPEGLIRTPAELRDLLAYLGSLKK